MSSLIANHLVLHYVGLHKKKRDRVLLTEDIKFDIMATPYWFFRPFLAKTNQNMMVVFSLKFKHKRPCFTGLICPLLPFPVKLHPDLWINHAIKPAFEF